jgi:two-component system chemotaxis sensor kinase CheA
MLQEEKQTISPTDLEATVNALAMRLVMAEPAETSGWLPDIEALAGQAAASGPDSVSKAAEQLKIRLRSLAPGTQEFLEAAQTGIQLVQEAIEASGVPGTASEPETSAGLAQDPELVNDFILESREHLQTIETNVLALEQDPELRDSVHAIFRAFHTIKGIAGFLEFQEIREISHETETVLDNARNGTLTVTPQIIDVILESADYLDREVRRIENGMREPAAPMEALQAKLHAVLNPSAEPQVSPELDALSRAVAGARVKESQAAGEGFPLSAEIAVAATQPTEPARTESVVTEPEPAEPAGRPSGSAEHNETSRTAPSNETPKANETSKAANGKTPQASSVKVDTAKLDFLVDMVGEMVIAQSLVRHHPDLTALQSATLLRNVAQLSRITDEVQKTAMSMRMMPVAILFQKMARLVRDLSRKSGKQAELITFGDDTELDRNIVEELADPLMHMVRNAVDHGIEPPADRIAKGKPAMARVELRASHEGGHIVIEIADDGRGMNRDAILRKARERGVVAKDAVLSDSEVYNLIFEPGFSTAEKVTEISGRGVGMDVVKRQIQKLRGRTEINTVLGKGSTFRLKLPLTLAIVDGLIVGVGEERYIVPLFAVKEMLRPTEGMVSTIEGKREIARVRDRVLPVVRLYRRFSVQPKTEDPLESLLVITESQGVEYCLMVDALHGKQEVVIKSLGESMKNIPGVAGGAILGDGRVGLILEMNAIFNPSGNR